MQSKTSKVILIRGCIRINHWKNHCSVIIMYSNMDIKETNLGNLDEIYQKIREIFTNVKPHEDMPIEKLVKKYSNDNSFLNDLKYIKESLSEITSILAPIDNLENEYSCFFSIRIMIEYLLNDIGLFIVHMSFIDDLLVNFFNLIHRRLVDDDNYDKCYNEINSFLEKQKEFFYNEIHEYDNEFEETIIEINNLW